MTSIATESSQTNTHEGQAEPYFRKSENIRNICGAASEDFAWALPVCCQPQQAHTCAQAPEVLSSLRRHIGVQFELDTPRLRTTNRHIHEHTGQRAIENQRRVLLIVDRGLQPHKLTQLEYV